jgi:transketolase
VLDLEPLSEKWQTCGWAVREIDGHDLGEITETLASIPFVSELPSCIIAHTVKGKGISFMEHQLLWHYRAPDAEELRRALAELDASE